jgi:hypothetical protein
MVRADQLEQSDRLIPIRSRKDFHKVVLKLEELASRSEVQGVAAEGVAAQAEA